MSEQPAKDGYYWFKKKGGNYWQVVRVMIKWNDVLFCGDEIPYCLEDLVGEWGNEVVRQNIP